MWYLIVSIPDLCTLTYFDEWQASWNYSILNKLIVIKPIIGEYQSVVGNIRKEVLARRHLGHTKVTNSFLLLAEEQPQYVGCEAPFTVRHFILECGDFAQEINASMLIA